MGEIRGHLSGYGGYLVLIEAGAVFIRGAVAWYNGLHIGPSSGGVV
jgi:hypothetical protein